MPILDDRGCFTSDTVNTAIDVTRTVDGVTIGAASVLSLAAGYIILGMTPQNEVDAINWEMSGGLVDALKLGMSAPFLYLGSEGLLKSGRLFAESAENFQNRITAPQKAEVYCLPFNFK